MTRPITILIAALGGEGGGVLADWLVEAAAHEGFPAQKTSIPGVSQRTGATTYYVEIYPERLDAAARQPVMALVPSPGNVDLMAASELVEAGRAMQNAFVTPERTTLVASTHRIYATSEKMIPGDGRYDARKILAAAARVARRALLFDMAALAKEAGSVINAVLFGAMAGSGALPLPREACEAAIRGAGKGAQASLRGFALGYARAAGGANAVGAALAGIPAADVAAKAAPARGGVVERIRREFPAALHPMLDLAVARIEDYQDPTYAALYLDRVRQVLAVDREAGGEADGWKLSRETARLLALWMCYEDVIRVADLKTRQSRFRRVRADVGAKPDQPVVIVDYLKPGIEEFSSLLPAAWAERLRNWEKKRGRELRVGMKLKTSSVIGFLLLRATAALKPWRRRTARYAQEQALIERWLGAVKRLGFAALDRGLALEIVQCARLVRGYGETHRRGCEAFVRIFDTLVEDEQAAAKGIDALKQAIRLARDAALAAAEGPPAAKGPAKGKPVIWVKSA
jgi:indolepyruvate ferredoxin oxidoreductase beta subunit